MTAAEREQKLEIMMDEYGNEILRLCRLCLREKSLAEDAAQETFLKAWRHMDSFRHESSEKTWLIRICVRTCRDMQRGRKWMLQHVSAEELHDRAAEPVYGEVTRTVLSLDQKYRLPLLLRYYLQLDTGEIARVLHLPVNTVRTRIRRGRDQMKTALEKGAWDA